MSDAGSDLLAHSHQCVRCTVEHFCRQRAALFLSARILLASNQLVSVSVERYITVTGRMSKLLIRNNHVLLLSSSSANCQSVGYEDLTEH